MIQNYKKKNNFLIFNFYKWLIHENINIKLAFFLLIFSFFAAIFTFLSFTNSLPFITSTPRLVISILTIDLLLLLFLCFKVIRRIIKIWIARKKGYAGSKISIKYILVFGLLALIPAVSVAIFSSFFFHLGIKTWFGEKVQKVFEESTNVANAYLNVHYQNIRSDITSMSNEIDNQFDFIFLDLKKLNVFLNRQVETRALTEGFIFKKNGAVIARAGFTISTTPDLITNYEMIQADKGNVIFTSKRSDRVRALIKLNKIINTYLVIGRFVDPTIINQVASVKLAAKSYNELLAQRTRIELNFYIVFILISLLILFIAVLMGLAFADNLINPISNLIHTSNLIKKGNLTAKVPQIDSKDEMSLLIKRFNEMTSTLEKQQKELRKRERNSAWSDIARRIAHEIKNPLTPIQLSAEFLKKNSKSSEYRNYASIIVKQVSSIEKMVDEFSKFARLPKPNIGKCNLNQMCKHLLLLHKRANPMIHFSIKSKKSQIHFNADESQISMAINNIIQNSIESVNQKHNKSKKNSGEISLLISKKLKKIIVQVNDNGIGLPNSNVKDRILEPYITTKSKGTGLGLAIVLKIIEQHNGTFSIFNNKINGASSLIELPKNI